MPQSRLKQKSLVLTKDRFTQADTAAPKHNESSHWAQQTEASLTHAANRAADVIPDAPTLHHNRRRSSSKQHDEHHQGVVDRAKQFMEEAAMKMGMSKKHPDQVGG